MSAPSTGLLENAAMATFWSSTLATAFGLAQMTNAGKPLEVQTANGCTAAAFTDGQGHVIVAFQGTQTPQQSLADVELMGGMKGSAIPGFQDAVAFTRTVEQVANARGIPSSSVFVTGHSLGGTLAEYVASQTGLGGASFAGSGVPGYKAPAATASNFTSYVEHGDAFANWSSDGAEHALIVPGTNQAHYGRLVFLGSAANDALTSTIISDVHALAPSLFNGGFAQAASRLSTDFTTNLLTIHGMNFYQRDIAAIPPPVAGAADHHVVGAVSMFAASS